MPPVIAAVAVEAIIAYVGYAATVAAIGALLTGVIISLGASVILGGLASLLAAKPKSPTSPVLDRSSMVKQPITYWQILLGQVKCSGAITFMASYASTTPGGTGSIISTVSFRYLPSGSPGDLQYTITSLGGNSYQYNFNANDAGEPIIISYQTNLGYQQQAFVIPAVTPFQVVLNATAGWVDLGVTTTNPNVNEQSPNSRLEMVLTIAGHPVESVGDIYLNDELVQFDSNFNAIGRWAGYCYAVPGLGTTAGDANFMAWGMQQAPDLWTKNHRQSGRSKIWITFIWNRDLFSGSIPNVSCIVNGANQIYDPRTSTYGWSSNAALCIRYYLQLANIINKAADNVNDTVTIASANTCDETVALANGGNELRYMCNGIIDTSRTPQEIIPDILSACAGKIAYCGGQWNILVGSYRTPTVTLDEDDLDGNVKTTTLISFRDGFNGVKGTYYSPVKNWQPWDFSPVQNALYLAQDGGVTNWADIQLPFTISDSAAQRVSKILLEETRQGITTYWPCKLSALQVQAGDVVLLTRARLGWVQKPFEVANFNFSVRGDPTTNSMRLGIDLVLRETSAAVYDWNSGLESTTDLAPNTNLPNVFNVQAPGVPTAQESSFLTLDSSGLNVNVTLTCTPSVDAYTISYQFEYMLQGASQWTILPPQATASTIIYGLAAGQYYFRAKVVNYAGISSGYSTSGITEIYALPVLPPDITGLTIQVVSSLAVLYWDQSQDLGVQNGGQIMIRHTQAAIGTATWEQGTEIVNAVSGTSNHAVVPLKQGTYMLKALNSGGLESADPAMVSASASSLFTYLGIATVEEDPSFLGSSVDIANTGGGIQLGGTGDWDLIPDVDLVTPSIDGYGGISSVGTYTFANIINVGSLQNVRLTTNIVSLVSNINDDIDSRTLNVDDWTDWDGGSGGTNCNAVIQVSTCSTDPTGSPVWSPYNNLVNADYNLWGARFQLVLNSDDPAYNINVSVLGVAATQVNGL